MRLTTEQHPTRHLNCAGIRRCDTCAREEGLKKPRRWDICSSCEKKSGIASGRRNKAPNQTKKQSYINYCQCCTKVFEVKSRALYRQKYCSSKCMGTAWKINNCLECGIKTAGARCDKCRETLWHKTTGKRKNKERYDNDLNYKLAITLRNRIKSALKTQISRKKNKYKQLAQVEVLLGCTLEELQTHIESQFQPGMAWDNYGHLTWHIDHIYPLSKIDLTDSEQLKKACHYSNLQPLWAMDNFSKYNKIPEGISI